jgi:uncharacterized membrane protein
MFDLNENLIYTVHGSGAELGFVDSYLQGFKQLKSIPLLDVLKTAMPGVSILENFHPLLVHFPIAFLLAFFVSDLLACVFKKIDLQRLAGVFLSLGVVFAGFTVLAGLKAAATVVHGGNVHEFMENHEHLGLLVFFLALILLAWRFFLKPALRSLYNYLYLVLAAWLCLLLVFTVDLGGLMVYKYGVAVAAAKALHAAEFDEHNHHAE